MKKNEISDNSIRIYNVMGARKFSNYLWGIFLVTSGLIFFITGFFSYLKISLYGFINTQNILFFPQGLAMSFYGLIAILLGTYLWVCIGLNVGSGFTEFNKKTGNVRIFRIGFPGKNRKIDFTYTLENIVCICIKIREGIAPQRGIYMRIQSTNTNIDELRDIPLDMDSMLYSTATLSDIEDKAADLSKYLKVSLNK